MSDEEKQPQGSVEINNGVLIVKCSLIQSKGKYLAKGLLIDAINAVDTFFFIAEQKRKQNEIIKPGIIPNGRH